MVEVDNLQGRSCKSGCYLLVGLAIVGLVGCTTSRHVYSDWKMTSRFLVDGSRRGPSELSGHVSIEDEYSAITDVTGTFVQTQRTQFDQTEDNCEFDGNYGWFYGIGGGLSGVGLLTMIVSGADDSQSGVAAGALALFVPGLLTWGIPLVVDMARPDDKPLSCVAYDTHSKTGNLNVRFTGQPVAYRISIDFGVQQRSFEARGKSRVDLRKAFKMCPYVLMTPERTYFSQVSAFPDADGYIRDLPTVVSVEHDGDVLAKETTTTPVLDLEQYLRDMLDAFVPDELRLPPFLVSTFTLEDLNSRVPIRSATVRVRAKRKLAIKFDVQLPQEALDFAEQLAGMPCNAKRVFLRSADKLMEEVEREAKENAPAPFVEAEVEEEKKENNKEEDKEEDKERETEVDKRGRISIGFYRDTKVHIEIRAADYYFLALDFEVGSDSRIIGLNSRHLKNKLLVDPNEDDSYIILLQDIGSRIRRAD